MPFSILIHDSFLTNSFRIFPIASSYSLISFSFKVRVSISELSTKNFENFCKLEVFSIDLLLKHFPNDEFSKTDKFISNSSFEWFFMKEHLELLLAKSLTAGSSLKRAYSFPSTLAISLQIVFSLSSWRSFIFTKL